MDRTLDWSYADKCILAACIALPFIGQEAVIQFYFLKHPDTVSYFNKAYQPFFAWSVAGIFAVWVMIVFWGRWLRRKNPFNTVIVHFLVQFIAIYQAYLAYSYGTFTSAFLVIVPCAGILGFLLFPRAFVMPGVGLSIVYLIGVTVLEQFDILPYGPLISSAPYADGRLSHVWLLNVGSVSIQFMAFVVVVCAYMFDLWRDREQKLKLSKQDLERSYQELEVRVRERTGQLVHANESLIEEIAQRKRAEEERLAIERKMLETQKLESLGLLAGGISHDFNNLISTMLGNAELALSELPENGPTTDSVRAVVTAARRAGDLTRQLLAYSGRGKFVVEPVNLNSLVLEMGQLLRVSIPKAISLDYHLAPNLPPVDGDVTQLRQMIMNLIINAAEAIGDAKGHINVATRSGLVERRMFADGYLPASRPEGDYVCLEIADSGQGMDEETRAKIFAPFFTTKFTGRGLGLPAVHGIVNGHKGAIRITSEKGKGTTFTILLPASNATAASTTSGTSPSALTWRGSGKVIVVDDEDAMRTVLKRILVRLGFDVVTFGSGFEALECFRRNPDEPCCLLIDMVMPGMNGKELFREVRKLAPLAHVVLMSGYSEEDAVGMINRDGRTGFLQKPISIEDLARKMREMTGG